MNARTDTGRHLLATATFAAIGAIAGAAIVHLIMPVYQVPRSISEMIYMPSLDRVGEINAEFAKVTTGNGAITMGLLGACIGLAIGVTAPRKRLMMGLVALVIGAVSGSVAGYTSGWIVSSISANLGRFAIAGYEMDAMFQAVLIQITAWAIPGAAIGLVVAKIEGASMGILAGLLAGIAYTIMASFVFAGTNMVTIVPPTISEQVIWSGLAGIFLGIGCGLSRAKLTAAASVSPQPKG